MVGLIEVYRDNPFSLWLGLGALLVAVNMITGFGRLIWPTAAAGAVAAIDLAGLQLSLPIEIGIFMVLTLGGALVPRKFTQPTSTFVPGIDAEAEDAVRAPKAPRRAAARPPGAPDASARLLGRIGRTTTEYVNGVGRVWIEGAEWGAELDMGEDALPPETPVRVIRVQGGVRLQVRPLHA